MTFTVFLGGPIQHATAPDGFFPPLRRDIEAAITALEAAGVKVFSAHLDEAFGALEDGFTPERVSTRDFNWMTRCHLYAAILPRGPDGRLMRSDGTHIEVGWASALRIPILMFVESGCSGELSFLVQGLHAVAASEIVEFESEGGCDPAALVAHVQRFAAENDAAGVSAAGLRRLNVI